ncbi:MAG TPA: 1,2-phenylacetyl-CoA epoxidase subunit PaaD [Bacteroidia bacterium]|jgi:ring-1,2-phenylacetyl-CoA epoxidase subunit PaaD|nr:1,2-phenylacetyl-CoA epoxidase subunit PaaD [Bacteroidia bacterium]
MVNYSEKDIFSFLEEIPDPEIPVISIVELGVIRKVKTTPGMVELEITPTYSGCPAMKQMEDDITTVLKAKGIERINIKTVYTPAWTTDWLSAEAREKLRKYGIAPPEESTSDKSVLTGKEKHVTCPRCGSKNTQLVSQFGSTACKALYKCRDCLEPFDYFKCI